MSYDNAVRHKYASMGNLRNGKFFLTLHIGYTIIFNAGAEGTSFAEMLYRIRLRIEISVFLPRFFYSFFTWRITNMKIQLSDKFTYGKLIRFTMPSIIMMVFTSIYGVVDGFFVP